MQKKLKYEEFFAQSTLFKYVDASAIKQQALDFAQKKNADVVSVTVDFKLGTSGGGFREYTVTLWYYP